MPNKIRKNLKKLLKLLESHLSLVVLLIFVIIILYASWLFYAFVYKPTVVQPEISFEKIKINRASLDRFVEQSDIQRQNILEATEKEYKDVFK